MPCSAAGFPFSLKPSFDHKTNFFMDVVSQLFALSHMYAQISDVHVWIMHVWQWGLNQVEMWIQI